MLSNISTNNYNIEMFVTKLNLFIVSGRRSDGSLDKEDRLHDDRR